MCIILRRYSPTYVTLRQISFEDLFTIWTNVITMPFANTTAFWKNPIEQKIEHKYYNRVKILKYDELIKEKY